MKTLHYPNQHTVETVIQNDDPLLVVTIITIPQRYRRHLDALKV